MVGDRERDRKKEREEENISVFGPFTKYLS